jgi:hypothetical protein
MHYVPPASANVRLEPKTLKAVLLLAAWLKAGSRKARR